MSAAASALALLLLAAVPAAPAHDEYTSLGAREDLPPDTSAARAHDAGFQVDYGPYFHRLRVTLGGCENDSWARIDDVTTGRADSRGVRARYRVGWSDPGT